MSYHSIEIKNKKVIAVLTVDNPDDTFSFAQACAEGGIELIEVLMNSANSLDVLSRISNIEGVTAGAGTVLDKNTAERAYDSGARFIVSPHTDSDIINFSKSRGLYVVSGAATSSELVNAWKLGADMVKVFPAAAIGGPEYIKALRKPLGFIDIMATGGITSENIVDYFRSGVSVVGISSALSEGSKPVKFSDVYENASKIMNIVSKFKA